MITATAHGEKHLCTNCNSPFYDLGRKPATCPRCEFVVAVRVKPPTSPYIDSKAARRQASLRRLAAKRSSKAASNT